MFAAFAGKLAVTVVLGFSAGFFGNATASAALAGAPPYSQGSGAFGGPVFHVGAIEWDLGQPSAPRLRRIRCTTLAAAAGTNCFVSG